MLTICQNRKPGPIHFTPVTTNGRLAERNAGGILPSPAGLPLPAPKQPHTFCGKVTEVVYDCFGDFEGFVLAWCNGERKFHSR